MSERAQPDFRLRRVPDAGAGNRPVIFKLRPREQRLPMTRRGFVQMSALSVGAAAAAVGCGGGSDGGGSGADSAPDFICPDPVRPPLTEDEYFDFSKNNIRAHAATVAQVRFSPDGRYLASAGGRASSGAARDHTEAKLWALPSGVLHGNVSDDHPISDLFFSEDGSQLVTVKLGNLAFWNMDVPDMTHQVVGSGGITWAILNDHVRSAGFAPGSVVPAYNIRLHKVSTGEEVARWSVPLAKAVYRVKMAPDAWRLAVTYQDGSVEIHNTSQMTLLRTLAGHDDPPIAQFSPDSSIVATAGGLTFGTSSVNPDLGDTSVKLWDSNTGALLHTLVGHTNKINEMKFTPDGRLLVTGSGGNVTTGGTPTFNDPSLDVFSHPDDDNSVRVWDVATGAEVAAITGNLYRITSVDISPDGQFVAVGSQDNTVKVWRVSDSAFVTGLFDANALEPDKQVNYVGTQLSDSTPVQRALPATAQLPPGAHCTCNCVAGTYAPRPPRGGGGPCQLVCVCVPVVFGPFSS